MTIKGTPPSKFGDELNKKFEVLLKMAVLHTDSLVKKGSPVDTGRFRASWQIGENGVGEYDAGPQHEPKNQPPSASSPLGGQIADPKGMNYVPGFEQLENTYTIHNSLPYAEALEQGHSKQNDPGWVKQISKDMQGWIKKAAGGLK